ncbi:cysteine--tRNA ligase [bacterium]|nr:cysteine--tRNA ligase [bacterium]
MSFHLFDTYQKKKVAFEPLTKGHVRMYNCGPTVYDYAHIGNFRAYIFADTLRRWLECSGYKVTQIMNITDVDDKTIKRALEEKKGLTDITKVYVDSFFEDLNTIHILPASHYPRATTHIDEMVELVQDLLERGFAYKTEDGSIYFRVSSFAEYGKLSGKKLEDLRIGERVSNDEYDSKDDVRDFALWKSWSERDGNVFWETPLGKGRPGWHIECSAMSMKYLGDVFDIHTGGVDNIFPHHENEIAQSRCGTDGDFSRYWAHCEYLLVEGKKMSKSLGNFYTLRDLTEKGYKARAIRYVLCATHYRSQLNFTMESLEAANNSLARIDDFRESWKNYPEGIIHAEVSGVLQRGDDQFTEAMNDDLNVSRALAALFTTIRELNALANDSKTSKADVSEIERYWNRWNHALGILEPFEAETATEIDDSWIQERIEARRDARAHKNWAEADRIRDELAAKNIELKDSADGTTWKFIG